MIRGLLAIVLSLLPFCAFAEFHGYIQYAVAHTFNTCFFDNSTGIAIEPTITFEQSGTFDIVISQDGTETNATTSIVNAPNDNGRCFDITIPAAETDAAAISVIFDDDDNLYLPFSVDFKTFGDLNASDKTRGIASGTAQSGTNGPPPKIKLAAATNLTNDYMIGATIYLTGGTGAGQRARIYDWVSADDDAFISTEYTDNVWLTAPDSTTTYIVFPLSQGLQACDASGVCDTNAIQFNGSATAAANAALDYTSGYTKANSETGVIDNAITAAKLSDDAAVELGAANALVSTTVATVSSQTQLDLLFSAPDFRFNDHLACITDADDGAGTSCEWVILSTDANNRITLQAALDFTVEVGDLVVITREKRTF